MVVSSDTIAMQLPWLCLGAMGGCYVAHMRLGIRWCMLLPAAVLDGLTIRRGPHNTLTSVNPLTVVLTRHLFILTRN